MCTWRLGEVCVLGEQRDAGVHAGYMKCVCFMSRQYRCMQMFH